MVVEKGPGVLLIIVGVAVVNGPEVEALILTGTCLVLEDVGALAGVGMADTATCSESLSSAEYIAVKAALVNKLLMTIPMVSRLPEKHICDRF